jgi:tetratricopeptide (TPR) repeat protein
MTDGSNAMNLLAQAQILFDAGRYEEARDFLSIVLDENPGNSAALRSMGLVLNRLGHPAQAFRFCQQAVQADPQDAEAHFSLALLYLAHGNYARGFIEYEWRLSRRGCVIHRYAQDAAMWDGRRLQDEAIMLHCEQGFGDNLQFIRFLPQLRERVGLIYLACHPELVRLFSSLEGIAGIFTDGDPLPRFQYHCPLLSLPRLFKTTLETLPREVPYLPGFGQSPPGDRRRRVGLVWRASRSSPNFGHRSVSLAALRSLAPLPLTWISLQRDPDEEELEILRADFAAEELGSTFSDFKDTAECLETLDLILTVDTSVAHLAGALGRPTWLLLPKCADWRWLRDRDDSPWYPSFTLFRQGVDGEWKAPLEAMREKLLQLTQT